MIHKYGLDWLFQMAWKHT